MGLRLYALTAPFRGIRMAVLLAALGAAAAVLVWGTGVVEDQLRTARDAVRSHDASGEIVIVEIDAASLAAIDSWPWPRSRHGRMVERLNEAGAQTIAFDVDFSSHSTPDEDQALADALAASEALVLLPAFHQLAGAGETEIVDSEPIPMLRDSAFLAAVNIRPDRNGSGQVRRALLGVTTNGLPRPSLPAMLAGTQGASDQDFPVDFAIDPDTIPRLSFADVETGAFDAAAVDGKIVMIGATAIEMGDRYPVPGHGVLPGVVIQALAAETLLAGGIPAEFGPGAALLIALAGVLILIARGSLLARGTGFAVSGLAVLVFPLVLERQYHATAHIAPALAMLLAAGVAGLALMSLRKYRQAALEDEISGLPNHAALVRDAKRSPHVKIVVGNIQGFTEAAALFSTDEIGVLFQELVRRLGITTNSAFYRIDDSLIAWRCDHVADDNLEDHMEAVTTLLRAPISIGSQRIDALLALGVAIGSGKDAPKLIAGAAAAADRATATGQRWERYVEGDDPDGKWHLALLGELDDAMESGDLWVAFQPKIDLASMDVTGAEALVRWQHPVRGAIPPDSFIPLAEKRGRIADLTLFTVDRTLDALASWQKAGNKTGLSVNVSATLLHNSRFMEALVKRVENSNVEPGLLTVEVTESAAMEDEESAVAAMHRLRSKGIRLSVDDYGTGQSTLSYLKRLPADEIKIDKSFVQGVEANPSDRILIRSTIELAHELNLKVVAEGIEDLDCLTILTEMGCDVGQGFFIGKPMPREEFEICIGAVAPKRRAA